MVWLRSGTYFEHLFRDFPVLGASLSTLGRSLATLGRLWVLFGDFGLLLGALWGLYTARPGAGKRGERVTNLALEP